MIENKRSQIIAAMTVFSSVIGAALLVAFLIYNWITEAPYGVSIFTIVVRWLGAFALLGLAIGLVTQIWLPFSRASKSALPWLINGVASTGFLMGFALLQLWGLSGFATNGFAYLGVAFIANWSVWLWLKWIFLGLMLAVALSEFNKETQSWAGNPFRPKITPAPTTPETTTAQPDDGALPDAVARAVKAARDAAGKG
jgi:hypothetical protein